MSEAQARQSELETLEGLWDAARSLPEPERSAYLNAALPVDAALRRELESLIACADQAERFFGHFEQVMHTAASAVARVSQSTRDVAPDSLGSVSDESMHLQPGRMLKQYRIEALLGQGGMGVVYRATDTRLHRTVALKFLRHADSRARERFVIEARAAAALDHPNICTIHEVSEDDEDALFIAMAYYQGETLQQILQRGPLPVLVAKDYTRQIARGLAAAHDRGIIHRDVKPANVIVTADGVAKLLDFGIARLPDQNVTQPGLTPGTVAYMSPEQITVQPLGATTDLWSLGVVFYEMLTGMRPFPGSAESAEEQRTQGDGATLHAILHALPVPASRRRADLPARIDSIMDGLLQKDPRARYSSAGDLVADLDSEGPPAHLAWRSWRRTRQRTMIGAVVAVAVILATLREAPLRRAGLDPLRSPETLAVLPFQDETGELGWLAGEMTRSLTDVLENVNGLRVRPLSAVLPFRDGRTPHDTIARLLGVNWLLGGSVRRERNRVVVRAEIVDGRTGELIESREIGSEHEDLELLEIAVGKATDEIEAFLRTRIGHEVNIQRWRAETRSLLAVQWLERAHALVAEKDSLMEADDMSGAWAALRRAEIGRAHV